MKQLLFRYRNLALLSVHGVGISPITISRTTIIQAVGLRACCGRVFSMVTFSVIGLTALPSRLVGPLAEFVPLQTIFLSIGLAAAGCSLLGSAIEGSCSWRGTARMAKLGIPRAE